MTCSAGVPICTAATCSPSIIGQIVTAVALPFFIGITVFRAWLSSLAQRFLPALFSKKII